MTLLAAEAVRQFRHHAESGVAVAFQFRRLQIALSARRCAQALALIRTQEPGLEVDGEMHADAALAEQIRDQRAARFDA